MLTESGEMTNEKARSILFAIERIHEELHMFQRLRLVPKKKILDMRRKVLSLYEEFRASFPHHHREDLHNAIQHEVPERREKLSERFLQTDNLAMYLVNTRKSKELDIVDCARHFSLAYGLGLSLELYLLLQLKKKLEKRGAKKLEKAIAADMEISQHSLAYFRFSRQRRSFKKV